MSNRNWLIPATVLALVASASPYALAGPPDGWHSTDLGFASQVLLGRDNAMWAAGAQESIAVSTDAGQHWTVKHRDPGGALLLVLHFVDENFGYAAGTGGKVLFTEDGGETWTAKKLVDASILQAAFGDPQHGVIHTMSALLSTTDGGKTWHPVAPANDSDWQHKFASVVDLAALDKNHLAVRLSEGEFGDGEYLWTADGGNTWAANYIPSVGIHDLFVADGDYFSIGNEVVGKSETGGGHGVAMSFRSRDGVEWKHIPLADGICKNEECGGCTPQGCFAGKNGAVDLSNGRSWMVAFPSHDGLSNEWAISGDTICLLSGGAVECATVKPVKSLDNLEEPITWEARSFPPLGASQAQGTGPRCIRCQLPPIFVTARGDSGPTDVQISFTLEPSGQVDNVKISGKVPQDVMSEIRAQITGWLFEPVVQEGKSVPKDLGMRGRLMIMNPEKPGPGMQFPAKR